MKKGIHPKYYAEATITCSCGSVFKTGSTQEKMEIEICSQCHPLYTGKQKALDSTGRVDRFKKLAEKTAAKKDAVKKSKIKAKKEKIEKIKKEVKKKPKKK